MTPSLVVARKSGALDLWEPGSPSSLRPFLRGHGGKIFHLQAYANSTRLLSAAHEGTVCAWDIQHEVPCWQTTVSCSLFALTIVGAHVVLGAQDGRIHLLHLDNG